LGHEILYLSRSDVESACRELDSVAIMREVFRLHGNGMTHLPAEAYLSWINRRGERVRSLSMPGYLGGALLAAGTKIINSNPANVRHRIRRASGVTLLFDETSTSIRCIMDASFISALRTASVTLVAAEILRAPVMDTIAVIGAGPIAGAHLDLLLRRVPEVRIVRIYDLDPVASARLRECAQVAASGARVDIELPGSARETIEGADLVITATTVTEGYIQFEWLKKGSILVHVSLDDVLPEVVLRASLVIVDDWDLVKADDRRLLGRMYRRGEIVGPGEPGRNGSRCVDSNLGDVVAGRHPGRTSSDQVILVNPFGLAIEDIAMARRVYDVASARGLGRILPE